MPRWTRRILSPSPREAAAWKGGSGRGAASTVATLLVVLALLGASATARANGAFPDSENVLTPADRPQDILIVTNFGLISSGDGGQTWLWSCEQDGNVLGSFYQLTPLPRNRLFTVTNQNVGYSDDRSCGWQVSGGAVAGQSITDAYLDPVSGTRVLAIGVAQSDLQPVPVDRRRDDLRARAVPGRGRHDDERRRDRAVQRQHRLPRDAHVGGRAAARALRRRRRALHGQRISVPAWARGCCASSRSIPRIRTAC